MKIHTHLGASVPFLLPAYRALFVCLAVSLAIASAIMVWQARERAGEIQRLQALTERYRTQSQREPAIDRDKVAEVARKVAAINALLPGEGRIDDLLRRLERLAPPAALVSELSLRANGEVRFIAEAADAQVLTQFLANLEAHERFTEVMMVNQAAARGGEKTRFEFRLRYRG